MHCETNSEQKVLATGLQIFLCDTMKMAAFPEAIQALSFTELLRLFSGTLGNFPGEKVADHCRWFGIGFVSSLGARCGFGLIYWVLYIARGADESSSVRAIRPTWCR